MQRKKIMQDAVQYPPELKLVLRCARTEPSEGDAELIARLCREPLDWPGFLRLVVRHRVAPLVLQSLRRTDQSAIPEEVERDLGRVVERNTLNALKQTSELVRLLRRFETGGVRVLPIKGPVLTIQAYEALKLRHAGDLDLLVDPASVWEADEILIAAGYKRIIPEYPLTAGQAAAFMTIRKDFTYFHAEKAVYVELHWRLSQNKHLVPLTLGELWSRRQFVRIGSEDVAAMSREDLLLYLCAHGAHTGWFRLKWLCDIAELIAEDDKASTEAVLERGDQLGSIRTLLQGFYLAHELLDAPLSASIQNSIKQDGVVMSMVGLATRSVLQDESNWSTDNTPVSWMPTQISYRLRLRADLPYKIQNFSFYSLWSDQYQHFRLPRRLYWIYFLFAPLLWVISVGRKCLPNSKHNRSL